MAVTRPKTATDSKIVPYSNFAPDSPVITDGAIQDAFGYFPIPAGFRTFPGVTAPGTGLPSPCFGYFSDLVLATPVFAAATASGLYIADSSGNLKPKSINFTNTANRWRFDTFGTPGGTTVNLYATNGIDPIQYYTVASGAWTAVPNSPPLASIVAASDYNLILVEPNSQTFVATFNALPTQWTGSVPLQIYVQSIPQSKGNITAACRMRNTMVFYKANAIHVSYFLGGTTGWDVQDSSVQQGVLNQEWVINTGDMHYFPSVGDHNFWSFDGYNLNRLNNSLSKFFRYDHNDAYMVNMIGHYDAIRGLLIWAYSSNQANPAGTLDTWLIYYLETGNWSFQRLNVEFLFNYFQSSDSHKLFGYWGQDHTPRYFDDSKAPGRAYVTSNFFGDYKNEYTCDTVRPAFPVYPTSATITPINQQKAGDIVGPPGDQGLIPGTKAEPLDGDGWFRFQTPNTARLQAFQITTQGLAEIVSIEPSIQWTGEVY